MARLFDADLLEPNPAITRSDLVVPGYTVFRRTMRQRWRPEELEKAPGWSDRTEATARAIVRLWQKLGRQPVPYAFKTAEGDVCTIDKGCLGFLRPYLEFMREDGFIIAVTPTAELRTKLDHTDTEAGLSADDADRSTAPATFQEALDRVLTSVRLRRGQQEFRRVLVAAYEGRCAVTGSTVVDILEAAHILPYDGPHTNAVSNGLLLRADIHTLFDCSLILFRENGTIEITSELRASEYARYDGRTLATPRTVEERPDRNILARRYRMAIDTRRALMAMASGVM